MTGGGVTGGGVTGAGLRPAPVIDQRWASNEAVNPIILLGDLTESSGQMLIETCRALETKRGELDTVCSRSRLPSDSQDFGTVSMVSAIEGALLTVAISMLGRIADSTVPMRHSIPSFPHLTCAKMSCTCRNAGGRLARLLTW